jgi:hypothetical protein
LEKNAILVVTIIEIRPFRNGWEVFEAPGVEPVFLEQDQAIDYAKHRACFRSGYSDLDRVATSSGRSISAKRTENCRAAEEESGIGDR